MALGPKKGLGTSSPCQGWNPPPEGGPLSPLFTATDMSEKHVVIPENPWGSGSLLLPLWLAPGKDSLSLRHNSASLSLSPAL